MHQTGDKECSRCKGLMVPERFQDILDGQLSFYGWRCLSCGEIVDPIIASNRHRRSATLSARDRKFFAHK